MDRLDVKDRKILYELDCNSRQSFRAIGRKVGLSKDVVVNRIKRMEKAGVIKSYWAEINTFKLGYNCYRIYLSYQDVSQEIKNQITNYFSKYKYSGAVLSVTGPIDLIVLLWINDSNNFDKFWNKTLDNFGMYFANHAVSIFTGGTGYKKTYLLNEEYQKTNRELFVLRGGGKTVDIDEIDYIILNEIVNNAKISTIELTKKTNCSSKTINNRLKNLQKQEVILAYRVNIDHKKIGVQNSSIDIYLKDHTKRRKIIEYIKFLPYVEYLIENIGWCDIQIEIWVPNFEKIREIIDDVETKFPGAIRKQDFMIADKYHKLRWLPELEFKKGNR